MTRIDLERVVFRKSSYSNGGNGCVEAGTFGSQHLVRDSKNPEGGFLVLEPDVWAAVVARIKRGACDL
ncbi:DUF397 domain-containing protein [Actinomadura madurae]|uniref:DUF397 domain-containing protein n=1 Tax=Actinomadura madurae TaxID=1993 RepID=UPI0020265A3A|nr:DUF397 domain-containing protein [Actinomadura madurae]MCP9950555.1 DUF397 domain-containing protein [Actinomadura madurae]MCP9967334.1 DUF397 domain-containing protein [Actinomadura madurae]MCP9979794.1 DUF397 domain-containing protein [Actinomadura madurae]MCQ0008676.1 DUF397 domain-containing protein [Actinomadura madurae]MCQ0015999.1 DUF397 domain-containing protein [Actinomadura madurae]